MIIARSRIDHGIHGFNNIGEYSDWCTNELESKTRDVGYITTLEVFEVKSGKRCNDDNKIDLSHFYNALKDKYKESVIDTSITDSIFNELHPAMTSSSIIGNWVYRLGLLLDKKIPLGNGLSNAHRIEIAVKNYVKS